MGQEERAGGCEQLGERRRTRPGVSASSRQGMEAAAVVTAADTCRILKCDQAGEWGPSTQGVHGVPGRSSAPTVTTQAPQHRPSLCIG